MLDMSPTTPIIEDDFVGQLGHSMSLSICKIQCFVCAEYFQMWPYFRVPGLMVSLITSTVQFLIGGDGILDTEFYVIKL